ncbi:hypothetical protein KXR87_06750 [Yokenella regensburgei]|uniref:hypothetical protein n=1 Tax=Yokenella regensburgei TaxID=158877 RepID=UPI003F18C279
MTEFAHNLWRLSLVAFGLFLPLRDASITPGALPAFIFARLPAAAGQRAVPARRNRSYS